MLIGRTTQVVPFQSLTGLNPNRTEISGKTPLHGHDPPTIFLWKSRNQCYFGADVTVLLQTILWFLITMLDYQETLLWIFVSMKKLPGTSVVVKHVGLSIRRKPFPQTPRSTEMDYAKPWLLKNHDLLAQARTDLQLQLVLIFPFFPPLISQWLCKPF